MSQGRTARAFVAGGLTIGLGWLMMKATSRTDQEIYDKLSPDLKRKVDQQRQAGARKAAYAEQLERAKQADSAEAPQWAPEERARQYRSSTPPPRLSS
ncbi:unnamed protein product [Sympodiomycopsis kandeliae]